MKLRHTLNGKRVWRGTLTEQQYKLAKVKLTKLSAIWFEGIQKQRLKKDGDIIISWDKLKKHLRCKYVPCTYEPQLYASWSNLRQGSRSVLEYIQEGEELIVLCEVNEPLGFLVV